LTATRFEGDSLAGCGNFVVIALMMEAASAFETSVNFLTRPYISADSHLQFFSSKNL
jgi:hypothetical protein